MEQNKKVVGCSCMSADITEFQIKKPPAEKVSNTSPAYEKSTVKPRPTTLPFIRPPLYYKHIIWPKIKTLSLPHFRLSKKSFVRCKAPDLSRLRRSRGRFNSRPKRFVLLAKKLERSTCSKSTLFFKTSFTLTLCLNDLEPIDSGTNEGSNWPLFLIFWVYVLLCITSQST